MKLTFLIITCTCILFSCNMKKETDKNSNVQANDSTLYNNPEANSNEDEYYSEFYEAYFSNYSFEGINVFQPMAYNESDYSKQLFHIMDTIVGLFQSGNRYQLKKCWIVKVNLFENECTESTMIEPTLNTREQCLYLFRGLNKHKNGILDTVPANIVLPVGEQKDFVFNNVTYNLKAEGKVTGEDRGSWDHIKNYKLYLTSDGKTQCITEMPTFKDTVTTITFIGDMDGDGKPDFIIDSPDWYEDYRILLLLSSFAEEGDFVKLVSITVDSFAC